MGLFSGSISDEEWIAFAKPLFQAASEPASSLSQAIRDEDLRAQMEGISRIVREFPSLEGAIKKGRSPTSSIAREAKKSFQLGLRDYVDGASQGLKLYRDLQGGLGERALLDGFAGRAATGRTAFQLSFYTRIVEKAEGRLRSAGSYIA